jgi:hypothetical protein
VLFKVRTGADPVNDSEEAGICKRRQNAMPGAAMQVYALRAVGQKGAGAGGEVGADHHQKRVFGHRQKGLRALRVAFDQVKAIGKTAGLRQKDRYSGPGISEIQLGLVVVALAQSSVDGTEISCRIKDIAKGCEGLRGQGLGVDQCHGAPDWTG